jgi:hypothetical protein
MSRLCVIFSVRYVGARGDQASRMPLNRRWVRYEARHEGKPVWRLGHSSAVEDLGSLNMPGTYGHSDRE